VFEILQQEPNVGLWFATLIGLMVGSFGNVVIARLPVILKRQWQIDCALSLEQAPPKFEKFNLSVPRSHCPRCKTFLSWYENIPVLSYVLQLGRCRHCKTRISFRYPLVELIAAALTYAAIASFGFTALGWSYTVLLWCLLILTLIDVDEMLLPDQITLPLLWLGLLLSISILPVSPQDAIIGAAAGYLVLWSVFWLFKIVTKKEGMGYGDFKLLALLGTWLGWQSLPLIILLSSIIGAVIGLFFLVIKKSQPGQPIPFGPFLAGAGVVALFWGERIYHWYWGLVV